MRTRISYLALVLALPILALALEPQMPLSPKPGASGQNQASDIAVACPAATDFQRNPGVRMPPFPPVPVAPEPGSKVSGPVITLVVSAPAETKLFHYQVFRADGCIPGPGPVWEAYSRESSWTLPMMLPIEPGVYRWSCRVHDGYGWSIWFAPWWTFEVENLPEKNETQGSSFDMGCPSCVACPNPFGQNGTTVRWNAGDGPNEVQIYDVSGCCVRTIRAVGCRPSAVSSVIWDGTDMAGNKAGAGTYLCRVRTEGRDHVVTLTKSR